MSSVILLLTSKAEQDVARKIAKTLQWFGIPSQLRVASPQRNPRSLLEMLEEYEAEPGPRVYITLAGRNSALPGLVDGAVRSPVIACLHSAEAGGPDLAAALHLPSGVATAAVLDPDNAALLAAKMLALADPALQDKLQDLRTRQTSRLYAEDKELRGDRPAGDRTAE